MWDTESTDNATDTTPWFDAVRSRKSKGSQAKRPGSLAGIHQAKKEHQGQFFTPTKIAKIMWQIVEPAINRARKRNNGKVAIFDNAIGSGRLVQFCHANHHVIYGNDIDQDAVTELREACKSVMIENHIKDVPMQDMRALNMGVALINPPFSLTLNSTELERLHGVTRGHLGEHTQAISHEYALAQALNAASMVVAILPRTYAHSLAETGPNKERLQTLVDLPAGAFREEGTEVAVSLAIYGPERSALPVNFETWRTWEEPIPQIRGECTDRWESTPFFVNATQDRQRITLPVTGIKTIRLVRAKRRIKMQFQCGLMQAMAQQAVYREVVPNAPSPCYHRYPSGMRYTGQALLDIEVLLNQPISIAHPLRPLIQTLEGAGATVEVCPSLAGYMRRRATQLQRWMTPYRHVVPASTMMQAVTITAITKHAILVNPKMWGSPRIEAGTALVFTTHDGYKTCHYGEHVIHRDNKSFATDFQEIKEAQQDSWVVRHEGRCAAFPQLAKHIECEAKSRGVDQILSWDYQLHDLIELRMSPGGICAWEPGLGKGRLDLALALMGGKKTIIVLEPHLVAELETEILDAKLDPSQWQIIESVEQARNLKRINLITYNRARMQICAGSRRTYAHLMRRRASQVIADEGHVLANDDTAQSIAIRHLSPKRLYVLTATPVPNYSRDLLPIASAVAGQGNALQPYSKKAAIGFCEPRLINSTAYAKRGLDAFIEDFVTTQWVTHTFNDTMRGGKREIPQAKSPSLFRSWAAPLVKRRTVKEPEVAKYIKTPDSKTFIVPVEWDEAHLSLYLKVCDDFAEYYRRTKQSANERSGGINMITLLARIGAVEEACTRPSTGIRGFGGYQPITSKERKAIELVRKWTAEGRKSIVYARSPISLQRLEKELAKLGIESVRNDGTQSIKKRTKAMREKFRFGNVPVLLAGMECSESGLNLPEASRVVFLDGAWVPKTEKQCKGRPLRPQQKEVVEFHFLVMVGSIDEYKRQAVDKKSGVTDCYLDAIEVEDDSEFLHLDHFINRFVEDLAKMHGLKNHDMRELLK